MPKGKTRNAVALSRTINHLKFECKLCDYTILSNNVKFVKMATRLHYKKCHPCENSSNAARVIAEDVVDIYMDAGTSMNGLHQFQR